MASPVKARPISTLSQNTLESNVDLLSGISDVLHRLETHFEGQQARLEFIESCMRSGTVSPVSNDPAIKKITPTSGLDTHSPNMSYAFHEFPSRSSDIDSPAANYQASIWKLQRHFLSSNDGRSDIHDALEEPSHDKTRLERKTSPGPPTELATGNLEMKNDDAYSISVYPSEILSRSETTIPPVPPLPIVGSVEAGNKKELGPLEYSIPYSSTAPASRLSPEPTPSGPLSRSSSLKFWKSGVRDRPSFASARTTSSSIAKPRPPHERVEMAYCAYGNFFGSFSSSAERQANRKEITRLGALALPISEIQTGRKDLELAGLRRIFSRVLSKISSKRPQLVYSVY